MTRHSVLAVEQPPLAPPLVLAGRSPAVTQLRAEIDASRDAGCVLIEGEPGLDLADIARDVHVRRSQGPFVIVDCAAAEPLRVERELFGDPHRGAGAEELEHVDAASAIARANGGTLYLADVTDLSATAQLRLARLVRDREVVIGGAASPLAVTVIGSIAMEPDAASDGGRLRRDLHKHFDRARIAVPPLRRRVEDIPLLVDQIIAAVHGKDGPLPPPVTHPAMTVLAALPWTGNLVELRHAVTRLAAGAASGVIQLEDVLTQVRFDGNSTFALPAPFGAAPHAPSGTRPQGPSGTRSQTPLGTLPQAPFGTLRAARQQFEREYIALVIRHHRGHIGEAARALGIQRTNLYRKARQLGIAVARGSRALLLLAAIAAVPAVAHAQDGGSVFATGPVEWSPSVTLRDFGYDNNVFLESAGRAVEDITGTLSPTVGAKIAAPRFELTSSAAADLVYFERYAEQRAINQKYSGRAAVTISLFQPFVAGEWQRVRDRQSPEVDLRARRLSRQATVGLGLFSLSRASLSLSLSRSDVDYEAGQAFGAVDLRTQLNRTSEVVSAGFNFAITPLTSLTASAGLLRESYTLVAGKDQKSERISIGVQFAPDAAIRGHAQFGYSRLTVEDAAAIPFEGFTTDVDVSYTILDVTQLKVRYNRETTASIREPYYLQTQYGLDIQQAFLGPFELVGRATRQELNYPGLASREIAGHLDYVHTYAAGFLVRLSGTSAIDTSYEISHRRSSDVNLRYQRRRLITSISLGF